MVAEWWSNGIYPLVICYIALEKGPLIVDLPNNDGDFPVRYDGLPEGKPIKNLWSEKHGIKNRSSMGKSLWMTIKL